MTLVPLIMMSILTDDPQPAVHRSMSNAGARRLRDTALHPSSRQRLGPASHHPLDPCLLIDRQLRSVSDRRIVPGLLGLDPSHIKELGRHVSLENVSHTSIKTVSLPRNPRGKAHQQGLPTRVAWPRLAISRGSLDEVRRMRGETPCLRSEGRTRPE